MRNNIPVVSTTNMLLLDKDKALFIERSEKLENFPGWYMLPGGKQEHNETTKQAAIRETFEETGLRVSEPELKVVATHFHDYKPKVYLVFIFLANKFFGKLIDRSKEGRPVWLSIDKVLQDPKLYPDLKRHIQLVFEATESGIIFTYHRFNNKLQIVETI